jgi:xanthine dehydrogenase molybdenum-binding subunit
MAKDDTSDFSRRSFLEATVATAVAATTRPVFTEGGPQATGPQADAVPRTTIQLTVNGTNHRVEVEDRWTLVELLRDHLGLTGTKIGCDRGECGACTVLVEAKPVYSCSQLAVWMDGRSVQTVEGLARGAQLDRLQQAFIDHDGPQCGFCTSGQIMAAYALLSRNPHPSVDDASAAMTGNLCRCANYNRYVEAVVAAGTAASAARPAHAEIASNIPALRTLGHSTPRIDAMERVTGSAKYTGDVQLPGMLYGRILRSPHPHARIRRIDTARAAALPGVKAVLTHENGSAVWGAGSISGGQQYNDDVKKITKHRRYTFNNPVRFVGDPVAAVAAVNRHVAEEALRLIAVDYEPLPFVLDPEEALKAGAPPIWPEGNLSPNARNELQPIASRRGNVEQAFQSSARVFEDRYSTAFVHNAQMEPRAAVASWEGPKLTVYTPTGGIANCRTDMARDLGLAPENVRVICQYMGGNFGNKNQNQDVDLIAALLAKAAAAPVKVELSRKEDFIGVHGRWPTVQYYKVGVAADGTLNGFQLRGYSGMGPYRKNSGSIGGAELYRCANVETVIHPVYTNRTVSGNFRGPEYPQGFFGIESMMDDVAAKLGMDPVEFVLKNMTRMSRDEVPYSNYTLEECIQRGAAAFDWARRWRRQPGSDPGPIKRGAGMAFMTFRSGLGRSSAVLRVDARGRYTVFVGVTDVGSGAKTTMALIAAEELGVPLSSVDVVWGDTDRCPYSVGESGSRTTIMTGYAVVEAARDLKRQVAEKGLPKGEETLVASATPNPTVTGRVRQAFGAHFVEVAVDTELGHARVTKYVAVHDSGRLMNPLTAASQIKGAAVQGISMALHEDLVYDRRSGQPLTAGYYGARIPTHRDAPEIEVIFIESDDGLGPFGAKSIGESGIILSPAAVANAVANAIGRRLKDLPITRDKILGALV